MRLFNKYLSFFLISVIAVLLVSACEGISPDTNNPATGKADVVADTTAPTAPTGLATTNITSSSVSLSWYAATDNVGVIGYRVYRGTVLVTTTTSLAYTNSGLTSATAYQYHVDAIDAASNATSSSTITATTSSSGGSGGSGACTGSAIQACPVTNGSGYQIRQCSNATWGSFGSCNITCDPGYMLSGQTCVVDSTQNYNNVYYMDDTGGSDSNNGSETLPWATFDHAWTVLQPGNLLIVKDGTYQQAMVPRMSGAAGSPITIRAENRGLAIITPADNAPPAANACYDGEQDLAIHVFSCQGNNPRIVHDLIIDGFIARGKGENSAIGVGSSDSANLEEEMTYNIVVRNTGAFGSITGTNNVVFSIGNNLRDSLFEDIFSYGAGRKALSAFGSIRIVIRRAVVRYDFWTGDGYKPNDPRVSFSGYNTVDSIFENMIALDDAQARGAEAASRTGFVASGNATDVSGITASSNNQYLGIISLNNIGNGFELNGGSSPYPMSSIKLENVISFKNTASGINVQGNSAGTEIAYSTVGENSSIGVRLDPSSTTITATNIHHNYVYNNNHYGFSYSANQVSTFANNSSVGNVGNNAAGQPTGDIEAGSVPVMNYLVNPTPVVGSERGATIVKRYKNGVLTNDALWPWPNQDLIRLHMCNAVDLAAVDRNLNNPTMVPAWCAGTKNLSNYIWEYLGNTAPANYGN